MSSPTWPVGFVMPFNRYETACVTALRIALDAGAHLKAAQTLVPEGKWGRWLKDNCFLSVRTAQLYVQLAENREAIEHKLIDSPKLSLRAARRLISKPKETKPKPKSSRVYGQHCAVAGDKLSRTVTYALRQALSLQEDAHEGELAPGVVNALNGILRRLQSAGLSLHDLDVTVRASTRRARAA